MGPKPDENRPNFVFFFEILCPQSPQIALKKNDFYFKIADIKPRCSKKCFFPNIRGLGPIYRSQVTRDEDWYQMLDGLSGLSSNTLISLGDDFSKPIYKQ